MGLFLCFFTCGSVPARIPNTDVQDTEEHRRVLAFCERYRAGLEGLDSSVRYEFRYERVREMPDHSLRVEYRARVSHREHGDWRAREQRRRLSLARVGPSFRITGGS